MNVLTSMLSMIIMVFCYYPSAITNSAYTNAFIPSLSKTPKHGQFLHKLRNTDLRIIPSSTSRSSTSTQLEMSKKKKSYNSSSSSSFASKLQQQNQTPIKSTSPLQAQFEYQELRAQFTTMLNQKIRPKMLSNEKNNELKSYLLKLLLNRSSSPIPLKSLSDNNGEAIYGTWTLVYSTNTQSLLNELPRDATVQLYFESNYKCQYKLLFAKTLGLKSIIAKSSYMIDSSPVNPGLVTIIYQDIVTDVFGVKGLPVGTFGLLKGRANYVESVWFDGILWIERGYDGDGVEFFNVYMKEDDNNNDTW